MRGKTDTELGNMENSKPIDVRASAMSDSFGFSFSALELE